MLVDDANADLWQVKKAGLKSTEQACCPEMN
jgi:hypothetical protein